MDCYTRRRMLQMTGLLGLGATHPGAFGVTLDNLLQQAQPLAQSYLLGEAQEKQIGATYYSRYIEESGGAYPDQVAQSALKTFSQPFIATSQRSAFDWEVTLVKNDELNAWALPGGKLAVYSGLVAETRDPAELGSVVAHEIGHVELSHGIQQMRTQAFVSSLSAAGQQALAAYGGSTGAMSAQLLGQLEGPIFQMITSGYARKREFEADAHILAVFDKTGMDPAKADDFFRTLARRYPTNSTITTSLFSTHPGTEKRIQQIETLAAKRPRPPARKAPKGWAELKERIPVRPG